jgi:hypothetical protein
MVKQVDAQVQSLREVVVVVVVNTATKMGNAVFLCVPRKKVICDLVRKTDGEDLAFFLTYIKPV